VNDDGIVLPGLGDAGDRLFGTNDPNSVAGTGGTMGGDDEEDEEELVHPSKRKRSLSVS